jgi:long-chain-fatty-acid--CoA ligase ACSBG
MLSHDSLAWTAKHALMRCTSGRYNDEDRVVSYLPLSHIAGLLYDLLAVMGEGAAVYFARPDALQGTLV